MFLMDTLFGFGGPSTGAGHPVDRPVRLTELTEFGSNPGALRARIYIPANLRPGAPLVVVLHGSAQSALEYDIGSGWSIIAEREGFALLFPEQQRANNASLSFNWFVPADCTRDSGEALSIRQMVETVIAEHGVDRRRVFVTGLSAGGAMTSVMLATYPDVFSGGAIIAGLPYGCASNVPDALARMWGYGGPTEQELGELARGASEHDGPWPMISVWHGSGDSTVVPSNAEAIVGQWRALHALADAPTRTDEIGGYPRRVWCNADGRELIEEFSITGMGHGTPLDRDTLGDCGDYMLDARICSTSHIAAFWDLKAQSASPRLAVAA